MKKSKSTKKFLKSLNEFLLITVVISTAIALAVAFFNYHHKNEILILGRYEKVCRFLNDPAAYNECFLYKHVSGGKAGDIYKIAIKTAVAIPLVYLGGFVITSFFTKRKRH